MATAPTLDVRGGITEGELRAVADAVHRAHRSDLLVLAETLDAHLPALVREQAPASLVSWHFQVHRDPQGLIVSITATPSPLA